MRTIVDLHIHGPFAMACSKQTTIQKLADNAKLKGLNLLGTGDCLHPKWFQSLSSELNEDENGILWTKDKFPFIWQTEVSLMYTQDGKGRRIHHLLLMPNKDVVIQVRDAFLKKGRLDYDGRPIFGFSSIELVDMMRSISDQIEIIPAHALTPFFGIFGSKTGFDSVEQCFKEKSKYINSVETGLSADPSMLYRVSHFDKLNLVSFSDPHSYHSHRIGREATILELKNLNYKSIINSIRTGEGLTSTIEVDPNYGKYHFDGHRDCGISLSPEESKKHNNICPKCKQELTIGVLSRIEKLADRPEGYIKQNSKKFYSFVPLVDIISLILKRGVNTKTVLQEYSKLLSRFNTEFNILMDANFEDLKKETHEKIAEAIINIRQGKVKYKPGFDGVYGIPYFGDEVPKNPEIKKISKQLSQKDLNEFSH